ncbi:MAG: HTH-type transcriptional activator IlvY [SAR324 cluster bacterium]|nr:HTH-type transcriptional activator IlvY [SAR324 cluster bacterium]
MDLDTLRLFLHLSRTLHFGKTSQDCYLSPSTLSRIIKRLEEKLGHTLFIRNNRQVTLTSQGIQFREYAIDALARWEALQTELHEDAKVLQGEISLYCSVTACYSILPMTLNNLRQLYPDIHLKLEIGNSVHALHKIKDNSVDLIIATLPDSISNDLISHILAITPLVFVAPSAPCNVSTQIGSQTIEWSQVPMILPQTGLARSYVNKWFQEQDLTPKIYSEVVGNEAILALVSMGCGIGIVPQLVLEKSPLQSEVRILQITPKLPEFKVGVCLQKKKLQSSLVQACWNSIKF